MYIIIHIIVITKSSSPNHHTHTIITKSSHNHHHTQAKYDQKVNKGGRFQWACLQADSAPECMDYVAGGLADIRVGVCVHVCVCVCDAGC